MLLLLSKLNLAPLSGEAYVSVQKSVVTQASSAIPVMPLYLSMVFRIMKEKGLHEGCMEQIHRLFTTQLYKADGVQQRQMKRVVYVLMIGSFVMKFSKLVQTYGQQSQLKTYLN